MRGKLGKDKQNWGRRPRAAAASAGTSRLYLVTPATGPSRTAPKMFTMGFLNGLLETSACADSKTMPAFFPALRGRAPLRSPCFQNRPQKPRLRDLVMHLFPEPTFSLTPFCFQNRIASLNSCFENWTFSRTRALCRAYSEALLRFHVGWLTLDEPRTHPRNEWLALCQAAPKVSLLHAARHPGHGLP